MDMDVITIYSQSTQKYDVVESPDDESDSKGETMKLFCVDQDGARCNISLRVQNEGTRQLYVDFSDAMCVYNITER